MHVSRLRRKLSQEDQVKTIRGVGYQLAVNRNYVGTEG
jgi:DNA-binding response OmpR family regulator